MPTADETELLRLARALNQAADRGDRAALDALFADEYVSTGSGNVWGEYGRFGNKASAIAKFGAEPPPGLVNATTLSHERVTVVDDTGITTYLITDHWSDAEGEHTILCWVTDVWIRRQGTWRMVATHESVVSDAHSPTASPSAL